MYDDGNNYMNENYLPSNNEFIVIAGLFMPENMYFYLFKKCIMMANNYMNKNYLLSNNEFIVIVVFFIPENICF